MLKGKSCWLCGATEATAYSHSYAYPGGCEYQHWHCREVQQCRERRVKYLRKVAETAKTPREIEDQAEGWRFSSGFPAADVTEALLQAEFVYRIWEDPDAVINPGNGPTLHGGWTWFAETLDSWSVDLDPDRVEAFSQVVNWLDEWAKEPLPPQATAWWEKKEGWREPTLSQVVAPKLLALRQQLRQR